MLCHSHTSIKGVCSRAIPTDTCLLGEDWLKEFKDCQVNKWSQFKASFQRSFFRPSPTAGPLPTSPTFRDKPRQWLQIISPSCQEQPRLCTAGAILGPQQPQTEGQHEPSSTAARLAVIQKLQTTKDKVGLFSQLFPQLLTYFTERASCFHAVQLSQHLSAWQQITSDPAILELVQGAKIEFAEQPTQGPVRWRFSAQEHDVISTEIAELVKKGVVKPSAHEHDQIISPIFVTKKKDGSHCMMKASSIIILKWRC